MIKKKQLLKATANIYGLPECRFIRDVALWGKTWRWQICTKYGRHYLLKEKPYYLISQVFTMHQQFQAFLYESGAPVVKLCKTTSGSLWMPWDGRLFTLQEYQHSRHPDPSNTDDIEMFGSTIALFHLCAQSFYPEYLTDRSLPILRATYFPETWQDITYYTYHLDHLYHHIGCKAPSGPIWLRDWIAKKSCFLDNQKIPTTWIHGDMNCFNCLGNSQTGMLLVDFDNVHWGNRLSDVALAAASVGMICQFSETDSSKLYQELRTDYISVLLKGVQEVFPFTDAEKRCWSAFLGLGMIRALINYTDLYVTNKNLAIELKMFVERIIAMLSTIA